jgi:deoxyribose-phosphate aldolase
MKNIAKYIDHTNINTKAKAKDIKRTCDEAKKYNFRGVCINPEWVKFVKNELKGTDIETVVLIDPPMGLDTHQNRLKACKKAKKYDKILKDLKPLCKILPTKIIIGSGYLIDDEVAMASKITKKAGAICVKTATFKDPLGSDELWKKARHLKIMKKSAPGLLIKAAGKIKTLKDLKMMVKAGADIVGTSSGVEIIKGK